MDIADTHSQICRDLHYNEVFNVNKSTIFIRLLLIKIIFVKEELHPPIFNFLPLIPFVQHWPSFTYSPALWIQHCPAAICCSGVPPPHLGPSSVIGCWLLFQGSSSQHPMMGHFVFLLQKPPGMSPSHICSVISVQVTQPRSRPAILVLS